MHVIRNAEPVADFTLGLILSETRNISRSHEGIKRGCWRKEFVNSKHTTILKKSKSRFSRFGTYREVNGF